MKTSQNSFSPWRAALNDRCRKSSALHSLPTIATFHRNAQAGPARSSELAPWNALHILRHWARSSRLFFDGSRDASHDAATTITAPDASAPNVLHRSVLAFFCCCPCPMQHAPYCQVVQSTGAANSKECASVYRTIWSPASSVINCARDQLCSVCRSAHTS